MDNSVGPGVVRRGMARSRRGLTKSDVVPVFGMELLDFFEKVKLLHGSSRDVKIGEASGEGAGEAVQPVEEATVEQHAPIESQAMVAANPKGCGDGNFKEGAAEQNRGREERDVDGENGGGCHVPLSSAKNGEMGENAAASSKDGNRGRIHVLSRARWCLWVGRCDVGEGW